MDWRPYAASLGVGLLAGALYGLLGTRSPAPPVIALIGLLGMLLGEMATGWAKSRLSAGEAAAACLHAKSFAVAEAEPSRRPAA
jgi:XapX domain-containing protein